MKRWSFILFLLLAACSDEHQVLPPEPEPPVEGTEEVTIKVAFPSEAKTKSPSTYATGENIDNAIDALDVFVFLPAGDTNDPSDDIFIYQAKASKITDIPSNEYVKEVTVTLKRMLQKQRFVFVANMPSGLSLNLVEGQSIQQELVDQLKFDGTSFYEDQQSDPGIAIPMWGQKADSVSITSTSFSMAKDTVHLIRSMAKIKVSVANGVDFAIRGIYLYNVSQSGNIAPESDEWNAQTITEINPIPGRINIDHPYANTSLYVLESNTGENNNNDNPAYLVLKGTYNNTDYYYRIDFINKDGLYPLIRNHEYDLNIIGAKEGYATEDEAKNAPITEWNSSLIIDDSNLSINEVVFLENQYMLGISISSCLFDWDKTWVGKSLSGEDATDYFLLNVYTSYSGGWTAKLSDNSWAAIDNKTVSGAGSTSGTIKITANGENRTGADRETTLTITAGMLTKEVTIRQSGGANSRVIPIAGNTSATTTIPMAFVEKAYKEAHGGGDMPKDNLVARILWHDAGSGQATFSAGIASETVKVTATPGSTAYGNAVVAIVDRDPNISMIGGKNNDVVLWSFHIWSMPEDADVNAGFHNPNTPMLMKRVLGKSDTNNGMFYQWGRKDPFPKSAADISPAAARIVSAVNTDDNMANAIKNPATFYKQDNNYSYWTGVTAPANLWNTLKTYYDPCPVGWKVPANEDMKYADSSDNALGSLSAADGSWGNGTDVGVWTIEGGAGGNATSTGRPVRCVKDIRLINTNE